MNSVTVSSNHSTITSDEVKSVQAQSHHSTVAAEESFSELYDLLFDDNWSMLEKDSNLYDSVFVSD